MDLCLGGKTAVVTGASRGIGLAITLLLASDRTSNVTGADFRIDGGLVPTWQARGPPGRE